jgi:hypothetical protein
MTVVRRQFVDQMLRVPYGLVGQGYQVGAGDLVEHPATLAAGSDKAGQPQPAKVLGHRRARGTHLPGQRGDITLSLGEQPDQPQPGRLGQVGQHLSGESQHLVLVGSLVTR